jgi:hypothetical protein
MWRIVRDAGLQRGPALRGEAAVSALSMTRFIGPFLQTMRWNPHGKPTLRPSLQGRNCEGKRLFPGVFRVSAESATAARRARSKRTAR